MTGAHRLPGRRAANAVKAGRWVLAVTVAAAVAVALLGLVIYLAVVSTELELRAALWAAAAGMLAWAVARRRRYHRLAWGWAGIVLLASGQLADALARHAGWSAHARQVIAVTGDWLWVPMLALIGVPVLTGIRSGGLTWPPWRSSGRGR